MTGPVHSFVDDRRYPLFVKRQVGWGGGDVVGGEGTDDVVGGHF